MVETEREAVCVIYTESFVIQRRKRLSGFGSKVSSSSSCVSPDLLLFFGHSEITAGKLTLPLGAGSGNIRYSISLTQENEQTATFENAVTISDE